MILFVRRWLVSLAGMAALAGGGLAPVATAGPRLEESQGALRSALSCESLEGFQERAVLLVHGTGTDAESNWRDGFEAALASQGRPVCLVQLPHNGLVDLQRSTEYLVHATRRMYRLSGRRIDVVGHSQGGLEPVWALRFWRGMRHRIAKVVALGTPYSGTAAGDLFCVAATCPEAFWQFRPSSAFLARLASGDPTRRRVDYTSIYTDYDQAAQPPAQAARLRGASVVGVQEICPNRPVDHFLLADDAAAFAVVTHALDHPGRFGAAAVDAGAACQSFLPPGVDPVARIPRAASLPLALATSLATAPMATAEPPLRCYAVRACRR